MTSLRQEYEQLGPNRLLDVSNIDLATGEGATFADKAAAAARFEARNYAQTFMPHGPQFQRLGGIPRMIPTPYDNYYRPPNWNPPIISRNYPEYIMAILHIFGPEGIRTYGRTIARAGGQIGTNLPEPPQPIINVPQVPFLPRVPSPPRAPIRYTTGPVPNRIALPIIPRLETLVPTTPQQPARNPVIPRGPQFPIPALRPTVPTQRPPVPSPTVPRPTVPRATPLFPRF